MNIRYSYGFKILKLQPFIAVCQKVGRFFDLNFKYFLNCILWVSDNSGNARLLSAAIHAENVFTPFNCLLALICSFFIFSSVRSATCLNSNAWLNYKVNIGCDKLNNILFISIRMHLLFQHGLLLILQILFSIIFFYMVKV